MSNGHTAAGISATPVPEPILAVEIVSKTLKKQNKVGKLKSRMWAEAGSAADDSRASFSGHCRRFRDAPENFAANARNSVLRVLFITVPSLATGP